MSIIIAIKLLHHQKMRNAFYYFLRDKTAVRECLADILYKIKVRFLALRLILYEEFI